MDELTMATQTQPHRLDVVTLEMGNAVEDWKALADGSIHVLLKIGVRCPECRIEHHWYINRDGRTKCTDCDAFARGIGATDRRTA